MNAKELIQKLAAGVVEAATLMKTDKSAGIAKLEEIAKEVSDASEKIEEGVDPEATKEIAEEIAPQADVETINKLKAFTSIFKDEEEAKKGAEFIQKWVYMSIDSQSMDDMLTQLKDLLSGATAITKKEEETPEETVEEKIEKALQPLHEAIVKLGGEPAATRSADVEAIEKSNEGGLRTALMPQ